MIRVALMAQNSALRIGLREMLRDADDVTVVGETSSLQELEAFADRADVLVIVQTGGAAISNLMLEGEANPALLVLAAEADDLPLLDRYPVRSWGVLSLNVGEAEFVAAVRAVHEGLIVGEPAMLKPRLAHHNRVQLTQAAPLAETLTARELEVLQQIALGLANKQIALALGISEHTVKFHISSLTAKLGAANRTEAVRLGTQRGLIVL